jgi:3-deoxy-7-phosphoheptulonate synthase
MTTSPTPCEPAQALPSPAELRRSIPLSPTALDTVARARAAVRAVLRGADAKRLIVVSGPCSLHDPEAALEYAARLRAASAPLGDRVVPIMRTYFEKPRTRAGWRGLLHDPALDGSGDAAAGVALSRRLLAEIGALGVACAAELLDPLASSYLEDGLSLALIGARTAESQIHRALASGLAMPVGFKNGTDGGLECALDAMLVAGEPQTRLALLPDGRAGVVRTAGARDRMLVLRGGRAPNFDAASIGRALELLAPQRIARPLLVDCSHDNSGKRPERQPEVCRAVLEQARSGQRGIAGVMIESHLYGGKQPCAPGEPLRYGVSITDPCLGWKETEELLAEF